jgi:hypothetical protein
MKSFRTTVLPWAALVLVVALAGCSNDPKVVKVSGTLTYKGQPVKGADITFTPVDKGARPSTGRTDAEGRFTLEYARQGERVTEGAIAGKHTVSVKASPLAGTVREPGMQPVLSKDLKEFYDKYADGKSKEEVVIDKATSDLKLDLK